MVRWQQQVALIESGDEQSSLTIKDEQICKPWVQMYMALVKGVLYNRSCQLLFVLLTLSPAGDFQGMFPIGEFAHSKHSPWLRNLQVFILSGWLSSRFWLSQRRLTCRYMFWKRDSFASACKRFLLPRGKMFTTSAVCEKFREYWWIVTTKCSLNQAGF